MASGFTASNEALGLAGSSTLAATVRAVSARGLINAINLARGIATSPEMGIADAEKAEAMAQAYRGQLLALLAAGVGITPAELEQAL